MTRRGRAARWIGAIAAIVLVAIGIGAGVGRGSAPDLPTAEVTTGEFVDAVELRGETRVYVPSDRPAEHRVLLLVGFGLFGRLAGVTL